jgi:hypothetical protein
VTEWYKNLKKWQKGGLIGFIVGIILACITILSPYQDSLGEWLTNFHAALAFLSLSCTFFWPGDETRSAATVFTVEFGCLIVILYGGLGAVWGRIQQMVNPIWKWLLTALLALLLLLFYLAYML